MHQSSLSGDSPGALLKNSEIMNKNKKIGETSYRDIFMRLEDAYNDDYLEKGIIKRIQNDYNDNHFNDFIEIEKLIVQTKGTINCCKKCNSTNIISYGKCKNKTQRYYCNDCHSTFTNSYSSFLFSSKVNIKAYFSFLEALLSQVSTSSAAKIAKITLPTVIHGRKKCLWYLKIIKIT